MWYFSTYKKVPINNCKLLAEEVEVSPWNKICIYFIYHYKVYSKGKPHLIIKVAAMVNPVAGYFEMTQYK